MVTKDGIERKAFKGAHQNNFVAKLSRQPVFQIEETANYITKHNVLTMNRDIVGSDAKIDEIARPDVIQTLYISYMFILVFILINILH